MWIIGLLVLCAAPLIAQTIESPCEPAVDVKEAWAAWVDMDAAVTPYAERHERRLRRIEQLLERHPNDIRVHLLRQDLLAGPFRYKQQAVIDEYRRLSEKHPDSPIYQYLYASILAGRNTSKAIGILNSLLEKDPPVSRAHLKLAQIYQYPAFRDNEKALHHLEAFQKACPNSTEGYNIGRRLRDSAYVGRAIPQFRRIVENSEDPMVVRHYELLWSWEFSSLPANLHENARAKVAKDIERLRSLELTDSIYWYRTLEAGYRLLADERSQAWVHDEIAERFPDSREAVRQLTGSWYKAHPYPRGGGPEEMERWGKLLLAESDHWIERWPNDPNVWNGRLAALTALPAPEPGEVAHTAEHLLAVYRAQPDSFRSFPPVAYRIAELYLKVGIRIEDIPRLVEQGTQELLEAQEQRDSNDYISADQRDSGGSIVLRFTEGGPLRMEAYLQQKMFGEARQVLRDMESWLEEARPGLGAAAEKIQAFQRPQSLLWEMRGRLAEAEGRKPDAAIFYRAAAELNPLPSEPRVFRVKASERARTLWKELGGTLEGLQALSEQISSSPQTEQTVSRWIPANLLLPDFEITDLQGRLWKLADLQGKTTLINLWATWCGFCLPELPIVQQMYEDLRGHDDIQVITLNVNENPGEIEPFMRDNGYNFPVLPAAALVEKMIPLLSIPRNWIVNREGRVVYEQQGFDASAPPQEWLQKKSLELMKQLK